MLIPDRNVLQHNVMQSNLARLEDFQVKTMFEHGFRYLSKASGRFDYSFKQLCA